ncbi:MAG: ABC transporter substrate-binding protein [Caldilineaceae bacterium]|nr:ABC transporter substrate-binding protein [Caldilineaceae bacterium]
MQDVQGETPMPLRAAVSRRRFLQLVSAGVTVSALIACAPTAQPEQAAPAAAAPVVAESPGTVENGMMRPSGTPKPGGTLRAAFGVTTAHYDMHQGGSASVLCQVYSTLVRRNLVDGLRTVIPDLAESWEVTEDGLTYTFALRQGVTFHDGTPFTAEDVVASFERILNPPEGIVIPIRADLEMVDSIEKVDDFTIKLHLSSPRAYFLDLLAGVSMVIYAKKTLEEHNNDLREVLLAPGTGAFKFVEYKTAEKWTFERNADYWDSELPYTDRLELLHVPAWSDRGTAVLTDQADLSWNVSAETWAEGESRGDIVQVNRLANFGAYWMIFNLNKEPFGDARVRRAIQLGISRQNLIKAFATQEQINLTRWIPYGDPYATPAAAIAELPGYREDKTVDLEEAKQLLADAGFPDGIQGVEILAAAGPQAELLAPAFQDMLARNLNIQAEIRIIERAQLVEEQKVGNFTLVIDTPGHGISDISPRANLWWRTGGSQNWGGYSNADFDALLDQIDVEIDQAKRQDLIKQALDVLDQDPPWFLAGYTFHLPMWRNTVKGMLFNDRIFAEWGRLETAWLDV